MSLRPAWLRSLLNTVLDRRRGPVPESEPPVAAETNVSSHRSNGHPEQRLVQVPTSSASEKRSAACAGDAARSPGQPLPGTRAPSPPLPATLTGHRGLSTSPTVRRPWSQCDPEAAPELSSTQTA